MVGPELVDVSNIICPSRSVSDHLALAVSAAISLLILANLAESSREDETISLVGAMGIEELAGAP